MDVPDCTRSSDALVFTVLLLARDSMLMFSVIVFRRLLLQSDVKREGVYKWKRRETFEIYIQKARVGRASGSLSRNPSLAGRDTLLG